ncbi:hypothetical protein RJT34_26566 [Clitoria ternatea]|uniref:Uncharacterized protein n=1 Tax=Clitoria ternatea TaxID=43366 RepID=A0AAN9I977_CLITE
MEKRLRMFEGDPSEITTLCEAGYREHVLRETLKQVQLQKIHVANTVDVNGFVTRTSKNPVDWFPQGGPLAQILNFTNAYDIAPLRQNTNDGSYDVLVKDLLTILDIAQMVERILLLQKSLLLWLRLYAWCYLFLDSYGGKAFSEGDYKGKKMRPFSCTLKGVYCKVSIEE